MLKDRFARIARIVKHPRLIAFLGLVMLTVGVPLARAQGTCSAPSPECAVVGQFEITVSLGVGQRSNPVVGKSDIPLIVIPHVSYYGKRFFVENLELGYTLHDGDTNTFSLVAAPGYDRVFFYRNDLQNIFIAGGTATPTSGVFPSVPSLDEGRDLRVEPRRTTYLAGPEWTFAYGRVTGQLTALREVTGRHEGYEVRSGIAVPLIESKSSLVASAGFTWKSREVVQYYYGVDELYEPGSAFSPFIKLRYSRPLSERWTFNAFAHYERLPGSIANSPIVSANHVATVFAGGAFRIH
jgi:outer membrane protein